MSEDFQELENQIEVLQKIISNLKERIKQVEDNLNAKFKIQGKDAEINAEEWGIDKYNDYVRLPVLKEELLARCDELSFMEQRHKELIIDE